MVSGLRGERTLKDENKYINKNFTRYCLLGFGTKFFNLSPFILQRMVFTHSSCEHCGVLMCECAVIRKACLR